MLGIKINVEIVDDDTVQEFEKGASGEGKQLMQRICHPEPEFSASGVCPECAAHWFRVFNPETMEGIDGEGKLPEVGWHQNCVCEDIIFTGKAGYEFEPKKFGEEFEERYKKGDISSLGKTKERLFLDGALSIKNLLAIPGPPGAYENVPSARR